MKKFHTVIAYTDGSHIGGVDGTPVNKGTGAGIHAYCSEVDMEELISKFSTDDSGYIRVNELPEVITSKGYDKIPQSKMVGKGVPLESIGLTLLEAVIPIKPATSQVGELQAFISLVRNGDFECKNLIVHTDSNYLKLGVAQWLKNWIKNKWIKSNGGPVENKALWVEINDILKHLEYKGVNLTILKIKGHSDRYGNELADTLARLGSSKSFSANNGEGDFDEVWTTSKYGSVVEECDEGSDTTKDSEIKEEQKLKKPKKVKDEDKLLPIMLRQKFIYSKGGENTDKVKIGKEEFFRYYGGDHAKLKDDRLLIGKSHSDTIEYLTLLKEEVPVVDKLNNEMHTRMWGEVPLMYRLDLINIHNGTFISQNKFNLHFFHGLDLSDMHFNSNYNELFFDEKNWLSVAVNPPMLSYRQLEYFDTLTGWLKEVVTGKAEKSEKYSVEDITGLLFSEDGKPTNVYRKIDRFLKHKVKAPVTGKLVEVILPRNIAFPDRTYINKLQKYNLKIQIVARYESKHAFRAFVVISTDMGHQLITSYHSALRLYE